MSTTPRFWESKTLEQMSKQEWESLCDGCGKCCLVKLEDPDDGRLCFTAAVCEYYDQDDCQCSVYATRTQKVAGCLQLDASRRETWRWLPKSCAYRLIDEGRPLPEWHHLVCGDRDRVHSEGHSIYGRVVSEAHIHRDQLPELIVHWVDE